MQDALSISDMDWAKPHLLSVFKEVKESNGNINEILKSSNIIKIMSTISNYIRYDVISKNEVITYNIPNSLNKSVFDFA